MNKLRIIILLLVVGVASGCEVDNYDPPSAELHGSFIDAATNQPVPSDVIQGTVIQLIELGWVDNPTNVTQSLVIRNDGTYRNSMIFSGRYRISTVQGNFQPLEPIDNFEIKGSTKLDFSVIPYLRVTDASITKNGNKVVATFKVQRTSDDNVSRIALFAHPNVSVGQAVNSVKMERQLDNLTSPEEVHTLEIDLGNPNFVAGRTYHFRIGALSSISGARFNYGPTVAITK